MRELRFKPGETIIKEGEINDTAYILKSGTVEVRKKAKKGDIKLAELQVGSIFGEMGLIEDSPRTASVVAKTEVVVDEIKREDFIEILEEKAKFVIPIMKTLLERLRQTNELVAQLEDRLRIEHADKIPGDVPEIYIEGLTDESRKVLLNKRMKIRKFPFKIGRETMQKSQDIFIDNDLYLPDRPPFNVSRNHMSINYLSGEFYVLDRGSSLGTIVNGVKIGGGVSSFKANLKKGENTVILGSETSPFVFKIIIQ